MEATARHSLERIILGSMLTDPARFVAVVKPVLNGGQAFLGVGHQAIYAATVKLGPAASLLGVSESLHPEELRAFGGLSALSDLLDLREVATPPRVLHWAQTLEAEHVRTSLRSVLIGTAQGLAQGHDEAEAIAALRSQLDLIGGDRQAGRIMRDMDLNAFLAFPFERRPALIGSGTLTAGGFGVLYGQAGLGKSYLLLQLAVALATARPWVGIPTALEPKRVGVVSLELEGYQLQDRLATMLDGANGGEIPDGIFLHCRETLRGLIDLGTARDQEELIAWAKARALDVVILDPLSRIHCLEETAAELGRIVLPFLDRLRIETHAAVMLAHHERKAPQSGQKGPEDDMEALRGTTRLQSDPTCLFRLKRAPKSLPYEQERMILRNPKANHAAQLAEIFLDRLTNGTFEAGDAPPPPERKGEATRKRIMDLLWDNPEGMSAAEIAEKVKMTKRGVTNHLRTLQIPTIGRGPSTIYRVEFDPDNPEGKAADAPPLDF